MSSSTESFVLHLESDGYTLLHTNTYDVCPAPEDMNPNLTGWAMRQEMKRWARSHNYKSFVIYRNTGYQQDLHGDVYELYVKQQGAE